MIRTFQCQSCGGAYTETQTDGQLYFHACSPLPPDKHGVQLELPNRRDENLKLNQSGRILGIKGEGDGVRCVTDSKVDQPAWLAKVKADIAKREGLDDALANS